MFGEDTITALATPPGEGGIGIIRMSGPDSFSILEKLFVLKSGKPLTKPRERYLHYGNILEADGSAIDEVFIVRMTAPRSYTMEDVVEIHCHGGMIPINRIIKRLLSCGAVLAQPGEFTKRAFLNGRIDLAQAEGIMDFIHSRTEEAAKASFQQMEGSISQEMSKIRMSLLNTLAHIEVTIDYPEEDIENVFVEEIEAKLTAMQEDLGRLLQTADQGRLIREGIKTVIIGKPNVGKSSLLNALLKENRAIVTDIPGTTRDVIEDLINIRGILVRIMDTAGIRDTHDLVEQMGVAKSKELIDDADLILLILDASKPLEKEDRDIIQYMGKKRLLVLLNKTDQPFVIDLEEVNQLTGNVTAVRTSMMDGSGLDHVEDYIERLVHTGSLTASSGLLITNQRHQQALILARGYLMEAIHGIHMNMPLDLITIDIRNAWEALGEITGESLTENLIDKIFTEFCLGK